MVKTTNIYIVWHGCILLIQRSVEDDNLPNYWECPAGHVDVYCPEGDTILSRLEALRELREETGIVANPEDLVNLPQTSSKKHRSYLLNLQSPLPPRIGLSFEHSAFRWYSLRHSTKPKRIRPEVANFIEMFSV